MLLQGYIIFGNKIDNDVSSIVIVSLIFSLISLIYCASTRFGIDIAEDGFTDWPDQIRYSINSMCFYTFCVSFRVQTYILILVTFRSFGILVILVPAIINSIETKIYSKIWVPNILIDIFAPTVMLHVAKGKILYATKLYLYKYQFEIGVYTSYNLMVILQLTTFKFTSHLDKLHYGTKFEAGIEFSVFVLSILFLGVLNLLTFFIFWEYGLKGLLKFCRNFLLSKTTEFDRYIHHSLLRHKIRHKHESLYYCN